MSEQVHIQLRGYRKRANLTQDELACLLGYASGVPVSKYETNRRGYSLDTALRLQAIFRMPVADFFSDRYTKVELEVINRARELHAAWENSEERPEVDVSLKQVFLSDLIAGRPLRAHVSTWRNQRTMPPSLP